MSSEGVPVEPSTAIIEECQKRLENNGYAPNPYCRHCHGFGMVHPVDFTGKTIGGEVVPCQAKGCLADSKAAYRSGADYLKSLGISSPAHNFTAFKQIDGSEKAYNAFYNLAHGRTDKPFLLCFGGVGNGKTHLCEALVIVLNQRGLWCHIYTVADLMGKLKGGINTNTTEQLIQQFGEYPALVMDDWGVEYGTAFELQLLERIIDLRYRAGLVTVMTSNKSLEQLSEISERIVSRFTDVDMAEPVLNRAPDYRRR